MAGAAHTRPRVVTRDRGADPDADFRPILPKWPENKALQKIEDWERMPVAMSCPQLAARGQTAGGVHAPIGSRFSSV